MQTRIGSIPEQGQIVAVRQHRYVVVDVQPSALAELSEEPQHLVSLNSIEDDALGETLQVVWEIEPDARIDERVGLPDATGFDAPRKFDAFLNAVRWGAISSADVRLLQSAFRSGITIEDYQLDPLVRAVQMPRANLLVADDVGLGKTIEAGLVVQELLLRNCARTILVVCPSSLQIQWQDQMRDKFGLEFRIVDSELMRELRRSRGLHTNPWAHFPRLITSIDFIKRDRPMRLLKELLPAEGESKYPRKFDILIVDEAHNCAPVGRGQYATDSLRTGAIRILSPHFEHKLFLTATPHNGYRESFSALLELLDDQRFARGVAPDRQQLQAVMVRRMKSELPPLFDGTTRLPKRDIQALEVPYTKEEREVHAWLRKYSELRQRNTGVVVAQLQEPVYGRLLNGGFGKGHATLDVGSRKFEEVRRRVEVTLAHGFGRLCFAQEAQAFHGFSGTKQKKRFIERADFLRPSGRGLVLARCQQLCQRGGNRQQQRIFCLGTGQGTPVGLGARHILHQTAEAQAVSLQRGFGELFNRIHRATPIDRERHIARSVHRLAQDMVPGFARFHPYPACP